MTAIHVPFVDDDTSAENRVTASYLNSVTGHLNDEPISPAVAVHDANVIAFLAAGTGAASLLLRGRLRNVVYVTDYENSPGVFVIGDFDPTTGVGTDNRVGIQRALTYAMTVTGGCYVVFPPGRYYLGTGYTDATGGVTAQLLLGSRTVANAANNIVIVGQGAQIYPGAPGRALFLANANRIIIDGLQVFGYVGGALASTRESDQLISIGYSSKHITIQNCYLTNCLGWTIEGTGDPTIAGGGTGNTIFDIRVLNNVIKTRYGDGVPSSSGGSMSQRSLQFIDCQGSLITGNTFIGMKLDFEPNLDGQYMAFNHVIGNRGDGGFVTPVVPAGVSTYWADEAMGLYDGAGTRINGSIGFTAIPGAAKYRGNLVASNNVDYMTISCNGGDSFQCDLLANRFDLGKIKLGIVSSPTTRYLAVHDNIARAVTDATNGFIEIVGDMTYGSLKGNSVWTADLPCVALNGGSDAGTNVFENNTTGFGTRNGLGFTPHASSIDRGNAAASAGIRRTSVFHTGDYAPATGTVGTDTGPLVGAGTTDTYRCEVNITESATLTGIALLNGTVAAGNVQMKFFSGDGQIALAATASTAMAGTDAYQKVPFTAAVHIGQPGKYFVLVQFSDSGARFRTHVVGNFESTRAQSGTYGTFAVFTPSGAFVTGLGPIADVY